MTGAAYMCMKTRAILSSIALALPGGARAEAIFVPTVAGEWTAGDKVQADAKVWQVAGGGEEAAEQNAIEVAPGSFYLFRTCQDKKGKQVSTRVYHSSKQGTFGLKDKYPEAMHMVADLPVCVAKVARQGGEWLITAASRFALTWK